jgi:hypothetical protein
MQQTKPVLDYSSRELTTPVRGPWDELGLVPWLGGMIRKETAFAVDFKARRLYIRDARGIYTPHATWHIERRTAQLCTEHGVTRFWAPELAERVAKFITATAPGLDSL